jgi:hypothetical protein
MHYNAAALRFRYSHNHAVLLLQAAWQAAKDGSEGPLF